MASLMVLGALVTKHHRLGIRATEFCNLIVLDVKSLKNKVLAGPCPLPSVSVLSPRCWHFQSIPWLGVGHLLPASLTVKVVRANARGDFKVWPQVVLTHLKVRDLQKLIVILWFFLSHVIGNVATNKGQRTVGCCSGLPALGCVVTWWYPIDSTFRF